MKILGVLFIGTQKNELFYIGYPLQGLAKSPSNGHFDMPSVCELLLLLPLHVFTKIQYFINAFGLNGLTFMDELIVASILVNILKIHQNGMAKNLPLGL